MSTNTRTMHAPYVSARPYNEAEATFKTDCKEKKSISASASRRVGMRKGCKLPTYTNAQLKNMCGPVNEWNLSLPMGWMDFTNLPIDLKKQYLEMLGQEFRISEAELANLFHCSTAAIANYLSNLGLTGVLENAAKGQPFFKSAWICFLRKGKEIYEAKKREQEVQTTQHVQKKALETVSKKRSALCMSVETISRLCKKSPADYKKLEGGGIGVDDAEQWLKAARKINTKTAWGDLMDMSDEEVDALAKKVMGEMREEHGMTYRAIAAAVDMPYTSCYTIERQGLGRKTKAHFLLMATKWMRSAENGDSSAKVDSAINVEVVEPILKPISSTLEVDAEEKGAEKTVQTALGVAMTGRVETIIAALTKLYGLDANIQVVVQEN